MATANLALLKMHVNANDFTDDDAYLQHLLDTAKSHVIRSTRRTEAELIEMGDGTNLPDEINHAILMIAAHWYNQRESDAGVQMHAVPDSLQALTKPFRRLVEDETE